jgi:hypothetical protein
VDPADTLTRGLAGAIRAARGLVRLADGDTATALREIEAGLRTIGYEGDGLLLSLPTRVRWIRLLATIPTRRAEAIDMIRGELRHSGGHRLVWWHLELARALAAQGDVNGAAAEWRRFATLWAGADPAARALALRTDRRIDGPSDRPLDPPRVEAARAAVPRR